MQKDFKHSLPQYFFSIFNSSLHIFSQYSIAKIKQMLYFTRFGRTLTREMHNLYLLCKSFLRSTITKGTTGAIVEPFHRSVNI